MDDTFIYIVNLPTSINEMVVPCADGYTIYISSRLTKVQQERAYLHAMRHIEDGDYKDVYDVQKIELKAHKGE